MSYKKKARLSIIERLQRKTKIDKATNCWLYTGFIDKDGYGVIWYKRRNEKVHRISAEQYLGLNIDIISLNKQVNHKDKCRNKNCWNPEHIYIGSHSENMEDSVRIGTHRNKQKTHCPKNHPYDMICNYNGKEWRRCSICTRESDHKRNLKGRKRNA